MTTRNEIMDLFEALFTPLTRDGTLKRIDRRFYLASKVPAADKPCLLITEHEEEFQNDNISDPGIITIDGALWIYTDAAQDQAIVPIKILNDLIDAVTNKIKPNPISGRVTLGNVVTDVRINGRVLKSAGDLDGNGVAMIPVQILLPCF